MSLQEGTFNNYIEILRFSDILYQGEIIETDFENEFGTEFGTEAKINVTLDSKQTGTLFLNGSTTETLTFTNRKIRDSVALFDSVAGMTPSVGLSGTMTINLTDEQGAVVELLVFKESTMGDFMEITNDVRLHQTGILPDARYQVDVNSDTDVELNDKLRIDESRNYEVMEIINVRDRGLDLYKQIFLK